MFIKHYAPNRCFCIKAAKSTHNYKIAVACVQKMDVTVKIKIKKKSGGRGQEGCVQRIEVIVVKRKKSWGGGGVGRLKEDANGLVKLLLKFKKKMGGGGGGVRVDVIREVRLFVEIQKKQTLFFCFCFFLGGGSGRVGSGRLGGQGGCERRSEGFCENSK